MSHSNQKIKPALIEMVRMNECIYNPKHSQYNNKEIKSMIWDDIADKLNIDATKAREIWRSLRDGHMRYRKALKAGKKQGVYAWSDYLFFLDEMNDAKDSDAQEPSQVYFGEEIYAEVEKNSPLQQAEWMGDSDCSVLPEYNAQASYRRKKRKSDNMDKVIEYLQSKKKEHDAVDLLFMSYAKTFKSLPARKQAKLKVTLAKVFAEAEFGDVDSTND